VLLIKLEINELCAHFVLGAKFVGGIGGVMEEGDVEVGVIG
jgi:hypothetical protein